jgi:tetratricopeptide (TPR) repeat protein
MNAGDLAVEHKDNEAALREYSSAENIASTMEDVDPSRLAEMIYWHAQALAQMGRVAESLPLFKRAFSIYPNWVMMTPRVAKSGLLPNDPKVLEQIMAQAPEKK